MKVKKSPAKSRSRAKEEVIMAIFSLPGSDDRDNEIPKAEAKSEAESKNADAPPEKGNRAEPSIVDSEHSEPVSGNGTELKDQSVAPEPRKSIRPPRSPLQRAASRSNGKRSPGPTTAAGKAISSRNAIKHGLLSPRLTQLNAQTAKDFADLLSVFRDDLKPVGILEETLVEKIAHEYLRMAVAAKHFCDAAKYVVNTSDSVPGNLVRYDSMINRQFYQAMHQLEELQRLRRSEEVPAPVNAPISTRLATASDERSQGINHNYQTNPRSSLFSRFRFRQVEPHANIHRTVKHGTWQLANYQTNPRSASFSTFGLGSSALELEPSLVLTPGWHNHGAHLSRLYKGCMPIDSDFDSCHRRQ